MSGIKLLLMVSVAPETSAASPAGQPMQGSRLLHWIDPDQGFNEWHKVAADGLYSYSTRNFSSCSGGEQAQCSIAQQMYSATEA